MQSYHLVDTVSWPGKTSCTTVTARSLDDEFALYDSLIDRHMPILLSSNVSLQVLGTEYSMWRPPEPSWATVARGIRRALGMAVYSVITLKSNKVSSQESATPKFGELVLVLRSQINHGSVPQIQNKLNSYAQELHDLYTSEDYGRMVLSFAKITSGRP
jgi:hypothetical protein